MQNLAEAGRIKYHFANLELAAKNNKMLTSAVESLKAVNFAAIRNAILQKIVQGVLDFIGFDQWAIVAQAVEK